MAEKTSLIIYYDWAEDFAEMTDEEVGKLINAILRYDMTGEDTKFADRSMRTMFRHMKKQCDLNRDKYEKRCSVNTENGKKGGAPVGNQNAKKQPKTTENNRKQPKQPDSVTVTVTEYEYDKDNVCVKDDTHEGVVFAYFSENGFKSDPKRFIRYNIGKGNEDIFDNPKRWQALADLWEQKESSMNQEFDMNAWIGGDGT